MTDNASREALAARVRKLSAVATTAEREKRKRADFAAGMIARLQQRIDELKPKMQTGRGLMVLKDQLVKDEFAKLGIRLHNVNSGRTRLVPQAFARGFAAGAHVNINGGANAASGPVGQRRLA